MITREKFERFIKVQASGICNMLSEEVQIYADLTPNEHMDIITAYSDYEKEFDIHINDYDGIE